MQDASSPLSSLALDSPFCGEETWSSVMERMGSKEPLFGADPQDLAFGPFSSLPLNITPNHTHNSLHSIPIASIRPTIDENTPIGSPLEKDLLECSHLFGISMASPSSHRSDSSISSTSQISEFTRSVSPPIATSRATNSSASLSISPGPVHASTLPARINTASHLQEGPDSYWMSRSRETRMSVYSAMRPSNNVSDPSIISIQTVEPDSIPPSPSDPEIEAGTGNGTPDPSSEPPPASFVFNTALAEEFALQRKDSRKLGKKEKDEVKALKKREKSVQKLQKELAQLEKRRVTTMIPGIDSHHSLRTESLGLGPYPAHPVPQSLKIKKSSTPLSSSPPPTLIMRSPSNPLIPSSPPVAWRTGSTSLSSLDNVAPYAFGPAPNAASSTPSNPTLTFGPNSKS